MIQFKRIPDHIGIIPDGNRRWAVARGMEKEDGYDFGITPGKELFKEVFRLGIREVTTYIFTQENTRRPRKQVDAFRNAFLRFLEDINRPDASILIVGDTKSSFFPDALKKYTIPEEDRDKKTRLNFLVNYSWKWDLNQVLENAKQKTLKKGDILDNIGSRGVSRVDLVIRWGERTRLSGFLPLQTAYADIHIIPEMWPDFTIDQFHNALKWYQEQDVTLGG